MFDQDFFLQTQGRHGEILRGLIRCASAAQFDQMLGAVAYASIAGCKLLNESLRSASPRWTDVTKRWLVSIDFALTEPAALEFLAKLPNSEVRIPNALADTFPNIRPRRRFHDKLYTFEMSRAPDAVALFTGSANLTLGGLQLNDEQAVGMVWTPPLGISEQTMFDRFIAKKQLIEELFSQSLRLTSGLLAEYRGAWAKNGENAETDGSVVSRVLVPDPVIAIDQASALAAANSFWVDVRYVTPNRGHGLSGNQIDLPRGARVFFGFTAERVPRNTVLGAVQISYQDQVTPCHMRFGNNQMDKLNLPIPGAGGPATYMDQTLIFSREPNDVFELQVRPLAESDTWKARSSERDTLYEMQGGRQFGVF